MSNQPNLWGFDPNQIGGKVGNTHPETSQRASLRVKSGSQKAQAIRNLAFHDPDGLTAYELSKLMFNNAGDLISPNQTATRLGELREQGLVMYSFDDVGRPEERETTPGNTGLVHVLTTYGHQVALDLKLENNS